MEPRFMQRALLALMMLAPMAATLGVQVVTFRMAFFSDAISHSAFAGVAIGLLAAVDPRWTMPAFGVMVALGIIAVQRRSSLTSDAVIGVFLSAVVAFGLAIVSRDRNVSRDVQRFVYGDILTITDAEIWMLLSLFIVLLAFQIIAYNRLMLVGINPVLAEVHGIRVAALQYAFAVMVALVVAFSVWAVGVLLVTAMLVVPATAARNMARSAGGMFWWALAISASSACVGLIVSAQDWAGTATGATVIIVACVWFVVSMFVVRRRIGKRRSRPA
jgi:zinc transport system permease protein